VEFVHKKKKEFAVIPFNTIHRTQEGLLEPTTKNVSLIATIFIIGEILITKSGIPILEMGINHLVLFLLIVFVAVLKNYIDEKRRGNILSGGE